MLLEEVADPVAPVAAADQAQRDFGVRFRGCGLPGLDDQQTRGSGRGAGQKIAAAEVFRTNGLILHGSRGHGLESFVIWREVRG